MNIPFTRMIAGPVSYTPGIFNITWDPGGPGRPPWRTLERTRVPTDLETNPNEVQITRLIVDNRDSLIASMAAGGGQAVHLTPATTQDVRTLPRCGPSTPLCEPPGDGASD